VREEEQHCASIQACGDVVEDDACAFREFFKVTNGEGLGDVEEAEEEEGDEDVSGVRACVRSPCREKGLGEGDGEEGDPLACDFVDDDEAGIFAAAFSGGDGGGGDTDGDGEDGGEEGVEEEREGLRVEQENGDGPEEGSGAGAPGAGAGFAEAGAEEGGDGPSPEGFFLARERAHGAFRPAAFCGGDFGGLDAFGEGVLLSAHGRFLGAGIRGLRGGRDRGRES